jgi:plastocyanin
VPVAVVLAGAALAERKDDVPEMRLARSPLTAVSALLACLALAGCASSSTAGWTFAPPPSATPIPPASAGASGAPGASPAASADSPAASGASPAASGASPAASGASPAASGASPAASGASPAASGATADVTISALNIAFEQASVDAPAGKAFSLLFDNKDASVPHDVWIKDASGTVVFQGAIITGPGQTTYNVPALAAGTYTFTCSVHANMTGTLVAK